MEINRVAITGVRRETEGKIPQASIQSAWLNHLHPLKERLFILQHGLSLYGIKLHHHLLTSTAKDFRTLVAEAGFQDPPDPNVRILISDDPISQLPVIGDTHDLLIAMEIGTQESWKPHPLDKSVARLELLEEDIRSTIFDILLDLSFGNSFIPKRVISHIGESKRVILGQTAKFVKQEFPELAKSVGVDEHCPYISFSHVARQKGGFGTERHISRFVEIWDKFYTYTTEDSERRALAVNLICSFPKIKGQLSHSAVVKCVSKAEPGTYLAVVRRRSKEFASQDVKNRLYTTFSNLDVRGTGKRDFGLLRVAGSKTNQDILNHARRLASEGYVYFLRLSI